MTTFIDQDKIKHVEAKRYTGLKSNIDTIQCWMTSGFGQDLSVSPKSGEATIVGQGNTVPVHVGDWILRGKNKFKVMNDVKFRSRFV